MKFSILSCWNETDSFADIRRTYTECFQCSPCILLSKPVCFQKVSTTSRRRWYFLLSTQHSVVQLWLLPDNGTGSWLWCAESQFTGSQKAIKRDFKHNETGQVLKYFWKPKEKSVTQHIPKSSLWCANAGSDGMQSWVRFFQQLFRIRHFLHFVKSGF